MGVMGYLVDFLFSTSFRSALYLEYFGTRRMLVAASGLKISPFKDHQLFKARNNNRFVVQCLCGQFQLTRFSLCFLIKPSKETKKSCLIVKKVLVQIPTFLICGG